MCGIAGIVAFGGAELQGNLRDSVSQMVHRLRHRGPDASQTFVSDAGDVAFGVARLAIVDLQHGAQPFEVEYRMRKYCIAFNGEIYNHKHLRLDLEARGQVFRTRCDTEVALRVYVEWGLKGIHRLKGQFAFAIYDAKDRAVILARDRLGIKPLYYQRSPDGRLVFASEPKAILCLPGVSAALDKSALLEYFVCSALFPKGSLPLEHSFFEGIHSVHPGTVAVCSTTRLAIKTYYELPYPSRDAATDLAERMRCVFMKSLERMIPEEAPFGVLLSGGLDSSIVASCLSKKGIDFPCVTIRYEGVENPDYESALIVAGELRKKLIAPVLTPERLLGLVEPLVRALDGPHDAVRHLGLLAAYETLREASCKVAFVGEGADEFHMGYYWLYFGFGSNGEPTLDGDLFRERIFGAIASLGHVFATDFLDGIDSEAVADRILECYQENLVDPLDRIQRFYARKFLKYRLDANDVCGMSQGVEARLPFCDEDLVVLALSVAHNLNIAKDSEKVVLRRAFVDLVPPHAVGRRKYPIPNCTNETFLFGLLQALGDAAKQADGSVWNVISRDHLDVIARQGRQGHRIALDSAFPTVDQWDGGAYNRDLSAKIHFLLLTFLKWHEMYF